MLLSVFSNVFKISVYKENTNLAIYWADRVYDSGNLSFATIPFWKMPTVWFLFAVSMYGMFQMKFFEALGMGALYYALLLVVDVLAYACNDICNFVWEETKVYGWKAWLIALLGKMFLFIIILLVRRIFGKSAVETLSKREWIKFLVFPIFTIFMIAWMLVVVQSSQAGSGKIPIVLAFSLVGLNVFIYGLLYDILQKEVRTREYMVSMAKAEGKIQLYQKQTAFIHDYQNQMQCVRTLLMKKITRRQSSIWSRCVMWVRMYGMLLIRII